MYLFYILYLFLYIIDLFYLLINSMRCKKVSSKLLLLENRFQYKLDNLNINTGHFNTNIKQIKFQVTRRLNRTLSIYSININLNTLTNNKKHSISQFSAWELNYQFDTNVEMLHKLLIEMSNIHTHIQNLTISYKGIRLIMFGINIRHHDGKRRIKINRVQLYYKKYTLGSIHKLKTSVLGEDKTIYIDTCNSQIRTRFLYNKLGSVVKEIYSIYFVDGEGVLPKIMIRDIKHQCYLHNYLCFNIKDLLIEDNKLVIPGIKIKIWKKDSIWFNNLLVDLNKPKESIRIEYLRVRLFYSTCDKLYKSFIILRKYFMPIPNKKFKHVKNKAYGAIIINEKYIKTNNFEDSEDDSSPKGKYNRHTEIIDNYLHILEETIINMRIWIAEFKIDLSNKGTIYCDSVLFKKEGTENTIQMKSWSIANGKRIYIKKNEGSQESFNIKFNKNSLEIIPYSVWVYFDKKHYSNWIKIIKNNVDRLNQLFYSNFYAYNKGYLYESYRIRSCNINFNYKKRAPNMTGLLGGNKIQLLNCIGLEDVNLLLNDIQIAYPANWDMILEVMVMNYSKIIYEYNLNSIVRKVTNKKVADIINIKNNFKYYKNKVIKTIGKKTK